MFSQSLTVLELIRENVFISVIIFVQPQLVGVGFSTTYLCTKKVKGGEIPFPCVGCVVCQYCFLQKRIGNTSKTQ